MSESMHLRGGAGAETDPFSGLDDIKAWLNRQDEIEPFAVGWPLHQRVPVELGSLGFEDVTVQKIQPHPVFVFKGNIGSTGCGTEEALRRMVMKLAKHLGFNFRSADTVVSVRRRRFQLVICLEEKS